MISFDAETHTYIDENGVIIPNVTKILKPLYDFDHIAPAVLNAAAARGKKVHAATEDFDRAGIYDESFDVAPYLDVWRDFLKETGFVATAMEKIVHSPKYGYVGTLDRFGVLFGKDALIDIKSFAPSPGPSGPQTAAYAQALHEDGGPDPRRIKRFALHLSPTKYKLVPLTDKTDFSVFLSCLNIYNWRLNHYGNRD